MTGIINWTMLDRLCSERGMLDKLKIVLAASLFSVAGGILEFVAYLVLCPMIWGILMTILVPFFVASADHGTTAGLIGARIAGIVALPLAPIVGFFWGLKAVIVTGAVMIFASPFIRSDWMHAIAAAVVGGVCSVLLLDFDLDGTSMIPALVTSGALAALASGSLGRRARRCLQSAVGTRSSAASSGESVSS